MAMRIKSFGDYRDKARRRLPRMLFDYVDGAAMTEDSAAANASDLQGIRLCQKVMRDVSHIDLSIDVFGQRASLPVMLGPVGLAGLLARRGEIQAARGADAAGVPFCLSSMSACSVDEVAAGSPSPFWFQLYMLRDRGFMRDMLARVRAAGCPALILTVDLPLPGLRYRDFQSGLAGPPGLAGPAMRAAQVLGRPRWLWDVAIRGRPMTLGNVVPAMGSARRLADFFGWVSANQDPSVTWQDIDFVRSQWKGALIVKGVMTGEDARQAVAMGADGVIVSNHGGRQLDGAPSTVSVLPDIVRALKGAVPVLVDGGVQTGTDVVRLMALGAHGVLLGRAWAFALAAGGETGVREMLERMALEIRLAMAFTGARRLSDLDEAALAVAEPAHMLNTTVKAGRLPSGRV